MLTIRLLRIGKKHQPSYKIVVTDKRRAPAGGRFVEEIGSYDPKSKQRNIKKDRAQYWVSVGAQPSDTVHNMLVSDKVIDQPKRKIYFVKPEPKPEPVKEIQKEAPVAVAEEVKIEEAPAEIVEEPIIETPAETPAEEPTTETTETPAA
ncbi:MAG: 30S ribosomal protein S16 [Candidatus Paceibacterota bacterium]|jgi:small subunit ribosomal protein S16|nr:30S ribosomal protein S16 [bacterium]